MFKINSSRDVFSDFFILCFFCIYIGGFRAFLLVTKRKLCYYKMIDILHNSNRIEEAVRMENSSFVIITGLSGAGKSNAVKVFEDMGYFCVDNLPAPLITINSWNEWTETSYLEPDDLYGYGYLEAIKDVEFKG